MVELARVEAEAVGDARGVRALDGLAQARDDGVHLLGEVVVQVELEAGPGSGDLVRVVRAVGETFAARRAGGAPGGDVLGIASDFTATTYGTVSPCCVPSCLPWALRRSATWTCAWFAASG